MERPGLQRLLADIARGRVDVVVVYKIDRLTRSLADFARMVELFERHEVSFVSVTQSFNTTSSMGRLTLNVLLSFAQFEREVTGERIRDKIAASKAKGMWMGGYPPLGYDLPAPGSRALVVNEAEAETVRTIFRRYLELGSGHALQRWLDARGIRSKRTWRAPAGPSAASASAAGRSTTSCATGSISARSSTGASSRGPASRDRRCRSLRGRAGDARRQCAAARRPHRSHRPGAAERPHLRRRRPADVADHRLWQAGKLYRYYVSAPLQQGERRRPGDEAIRRVAATRWRRCSAR